MHYIMYNLAKYRIPALFVIFCSCQHFEQAEDLVLGSSLKRQWQNLITFYVKKIVICSAFIYFL